MTAGRRTAGGRGGLVLMVVAVAGALLTVGVLSSGRRDRGPYDPDSTAPEGTRGLVELARRFGAQVQEAGSFPVDADVAIAFQDVVPAADEDEVLDWVAAGRTLVIADPVSELVPRAEPAPAAATGIIPRGGCDIDAFARVDQLAVGTPRRVPLRFVPSDGPACFVDEHGAFAVLVPEGAGRIVGLADGTVLQNENLGRADNAVLVSALVAPRPGVRVAVLTGDTFPGGQPGEVNPIGSLMREPVRLALVQAGIAIGLLALARARRLGRPITEPQPVQIAGSSLVDAIGSLHARRRDPEAAAALLRSDVRHTLAGRVGMHPATDPSVLAEAVAARTGLPAQQVRAVLDGYPVTRDGDLVVLAEQIDHVRQEVLHGHTA